MDCPRCRLVNPATAQRCDCGYDFASGTMKASYLRVPGGERGPVAAAPYVGLGLRLAALFIDGVVFWAMGMMAAIALGFLDDPLGAVARLSRIVEGPWGGAFGVVFFAAFEASAWQGTLGKRILGLRVEAYSGGRITFLRSLGRNLAKNISGLLFPVALWQMAFGAERRALHDVISGTCVRRGRAASE